MSVTSHHAAGITANEALFTSECQAMRPSPTSGPIDPATGLEADGVPALIWAGRCWFKAPTSSSQDSIGGDVVTVQKPTIALPLGAPALRVGDDVEIVTSRIALNVGRRFKVAALPGGDFITMARYTVDEVMP